MPATRRIYDPFAGPTLDESHWMKSVLPLGPDAFWTYYDPNTKLDVASGTCTMEVNPFSRAHDAIQIADNPKTLFASVEKVKVPANGRLTFEADVAAWGYNNDAADIYDAFATFNMFDFDSALVFDFLLNGTKTIALMERLYIPGYTDETTSFCREADIAVATAPRQVHRYRMTYDRAADTFEWAIDGAVVHRTGDIPVKADAFWVGMGLMTIKPILAPFPYYFPKSTSLHGQGAGASWGAITVVTEEP